MHVFRKLQRFYWDYWYLGLGAVLSMALLTVVGLLRPKLLQWLIDGVIGQQRWGQLTWVVLAVLGIALARGCMQFARQWFGGLLGQHAVYNLRNALYEKLQYLGFHFYDNAMTGDLMSRLTADVEAFRMFLSFGFVMLLDVGYMVFFSLIFMLFTNAKLTVAALAMFPFLAVIVSRFQKRVHPAFYSVRESLSVLTAAVQENITGQRTVKSFARETHEVKRFEEKQVHYVQTNLQTAQIWSEYFPLVELFSYAGTAFLLWYGGRMVISGEIQIGQLAAFFSFIWYIIWPVREIGWQLNNLVQAVAAGERLLEILEQPSRIKNPQDAVVLESIRGHVRFEHVSFSYDGEQEILQDISLDAPPGTIIGLLGPTGAGKSSVTSLIPRFYDVGAGRVTVDGHDVRTLDLHALRRQVGIVLQETFLWSATIRENIAYGRRDASMEEIIAAAKMAEAHDFIMETPKGYDTVVGERGMGLSGGQKQRIAIARALLMNPKILILDDATASVDMETEHEIQKALRNVMKGRTTFIIAHRLSSLKHADEILVLEAGRVVQRGTHDQLLGHDGIYRQTYNVQFADREDDAIMGEVAASE